MAAGSFAKVAGSGQGIPGTTFSTLDFGTISVDADSILTETSGGVYRPDSAGYYLIVTEAVFQLTHNNRFNVHHKIRRNSTDVDGAHGSGYGRNNSNDEAYVAARMVMPFNGTSDTFDVQQRRDSGNGSSAGSYATTRIKVVQLTDSTSGVPFLHVGTPAASGYGGEGYSVTTGWDVITETDDTVLSFENGQDIRLHETGRPYLIVYGAMNSDSGGARTTRMSKLFYNDDPVHHSTGYAYQRSSACQYAVPNGMGLVKPTTADLDVDLRIAGYVDNNAVLWGTFDNGAWTLSASEAGMFAIALPASTDVAVYEDETGNQTINGTGIVDLNVFRSTVTETGVFSRTGNTAVDVTGATDVLGHAALAVERTASSGTRAMYSVRFEVEGSDQADTAAQKYQRGEQGGDDTKNTAISSTHVGGFSADDTVNVEKFISGGQNSGGSDVSEVAGAFFVDLSTLAAGGTPGSATPGVISASAVMPSVTVEGPQVVSPSATSLFVVLPAASTVIPSSSTFQYPGDLASADVFWAIDAAQLTGHSDGGKTVDAVPDQTGNEPASTADNGEEAVYRASSHFRRPSIEGDGSAHLDFDWETSHSPPLFTITAHKWLSGTGIRNVLHSAKKGEGPPNKHVQGTQSGNSGEGGEFHVLMSGDGSGPAHLDPSTDPGADGGDIDTVFVDEECVTLYTCAANGDIELWKLTQSKGWEQLIDGNSGANAMNGLSLLSREDGNTSSMANLAISYMIAGDGTNYSLDELKLAAEDIAEWCHVRKVLQRFELDGVTAELAVDYTDTDPYNMDGNGTLEDDLVLTVTGGTVHLEIDNALGLSWIDGDYTAGQHTLSLPVSNLVLWKDMTEIRMSVV